jgi:hypothetical protein
MCLIVTRITVLSLQNMTHRYLAEAQYRFNRRFDLSTMFRACFMLDQEQEAVLRSG